MTLAEYLTDRGIKAADFARQLDVAASVITRFLRGERGLSLDVAVRIEAATGGTVTCASLAKSAAAPAHGPDAVEVAA